MKLLLSIAFMIFFTSALYSQPVKNTSYTNQSSEKVLQLEVVLPVNTEAAWKLFTTDEGLMKWIAPVAHIELKTGGYILTNYDKAKAITDSSSIKLGIINFIENELITLKVTLNNNFDELARRSDGNLQEMIQLKKIDDTHTKVISLMVGFGTGKAWEKAYDFFTMGNEWTFKEILKTFN